MYRLTELASLYECREGKLKTFPEVMKNPGFFAACRSAKESDFVIDRSWGAFQRAAVSALPEIEAVLSDVKNERSDFVNEEAFRSLNVTLSSRTGLLTELQALPTPRSELEIAAVKDAAVQYKRLREELQRANDELAHYLKLSKADRLRAESFAFSRSPSSTSPKFGD